VKTVATNAATARKNRDGLGFGDACRGDLSWIRSERRAKYVSRVNVGPASCAGVRGGIAGDVEDEDLPPPTVQAW